MKKIPSGEEVAKMDFGDRLRELRMERELCQKELARHLKVSVSTISNYEKGVHFPDPVTLCRFADFYEVSIDYLLGRTKYRHSLELLDKPLADGSDISDFINDFVNLEFQTQREICQYVDYRRKIQAKHSRKKS